VRKTIDVTVAAEGRDNGKTFRITEMPAHQAEEWAMKALSAISKGGVELPPAALGGNMLVIVAVGIQALLSADFEAVKPLMAEMLECVQVLNRTEGGEVTLRRLTPDDTEDVATRLWLRDQVLELHTGFSLAGALSTLRAGATAQVSSPPARKTSRK
jgi:hypothetical protein